MSKAAEIYSRFQWRMAVGSPFPLSTSSNALVEKITQQACTVAEHTTVTAFAQQRFQARLDDIQPWQLQFLPKALAATCQSKAEAFCEQLLVDALTAKFQSQSWTLAIAPTVLPRSTDHSAANRIARQVKSITDHIVTMSVAQNLHSASWEQLTQMKPVISAAPGNDIIVAQCVGKAFALGELTGITAIGNQIAESGLRIPDNLIPAFRPQDSLLSKTIAAHSTAIAEGLTVQMTGTLLIAAQHLRKDAQRQQMETHNRRRVQAERIFSQWRSAYVDGGLPLSELKCRCSGDPVLRELFQQSHAFFTELEQDKQYIQTLFAGKAGPQPIPQKSETPVATPQPAEHLEVAATPATQRNAPRAKAKPKGGLGFWP